MSTGVSQAHRTGSAMQAMAQCVSDKSCGRTKLGLYFDNTPESTSPLADGIKKIAQVEAGARAVRGPKVVSIVDGHETAALTARDLEQMGFNVVFYAVTALFAAVKAVSEVLAELQRAGTPKGRAGATVSYEFSELVDLDLHKGLDDRYGA